MKVILIFAGALLALFGIFNYVIAMLKSKGKYISPVVYSIGGWAIFLVCFATIMFFGALLVKDPTKIFVHIHWGWILVIGIAAFIILLVVGIIWNVRGITRMGSSLIVVGISTLVLMIMGLGSAGGAEYTISSASQFKLLDNLPGNFGGYVINITEDLDFEGISVDSYYGSDNKYYIMGNGHTIKNLKYEATLEKGYTEFLKGDGTIEDLKLVDCEYYLKPNYYNEEAHEGYGCSFNIFGNYHLKNVEVDAIVYTREADDSPLYENLSYVSVILPSVVVVDNENVTLAEKTEFLENYYNELVMGGNNRFNIVVKEEGEE